MLAFALSSTGCPKDDSPFLPLPALCEERSQAICSARSFSCESEEEEDVETCQSRELALCDEQSEAYLDEPQLTYDSEVALQVRVDEQAALDTGEAPFPLARFFVGGSAIDADCERDSQCETGLCDAETGQCAESPEAPLCEPS
jgi:hypothetical protein